MIKAIPVMAVLAIAAAPALAQQQYPSDNPSTATSPPSSRAYDDDQQARQPETESPGTVETLRNRSMSAPNVKGDEVPENPATGVPAPEGRGDPKQLESVPRP